MQQCNNDPFVNVDWHYVYVPGTKLTVHKLWDFLERWCCQTFSFSFELKFIVVCLWQCWSHSVAVQFYLYIELVLQLARL